MNKREDYLSWDEVFMLMAFLISRRSKDPSTQNGAVIVDKKNIIVGLGYNGFPRGCSDEEFPWAREGEFLDKKYAYVVHAEANAIYNSNKPVENCKIYCTLFPCNECAKAIIQHGIKEVVYASDKYRNAPEWEAARRLFEAAGVRSREYKPKKELNLS